MATLNHVFLKIFQEETGSGTPVSEPGSGNACPEESSRLAGEETLRRVGKPGMECADTVAFPQAATPMATPTAIPATSRVGEDEGTGPSRRFRDVYSARSLSRTRGNETSYTGEEENGTGEKSDRSAELTLKVFGEASEGESGAGQTDRDGREQNGREQNGRDREIEFLSPIPGRFPSSCRRMLQRGAKELASLGDALQEARAAGHRVLGFKGMGPGTGCSTLLLGAVGELVRRGLSILVIDGNFENPVLATLLNIKVTFGWEDAVFEKRPLETSLMRVTLPVEKRVTIGPLRTSAFFHFLPLAAQTVSRAIVAGCKRQWFEMVQEVSQEFDLVLVDTGGSSMTTAEENVCEMLRFGIDGYFAVRDARRNADEVLRCCVERSDAYELPCLGIVENFV